MSDLVELTRALVAVESINPDLGSGGSGEPGVARVVADWAHRAGLDVELEEAAPGRPNVIVTVRGTGGGRSLMLNAHMDTVGVEGMTDPFSGRLEGARLYGRGAYDMKGSLAACLLAAAAVHRLRLRGDVVVTAVADEEYGSIGTEAIARRRTADAAIVTEPTEERLVLAHKGFVGFEIDIAGRAAHGSRPDLGIDAIARAGPVLTRIGELGERLQAGPAHPLLGTGSVHASLISGGQEYSSYPASCRIVAERRTVPGETRDVVSAEIDELLGDVQGSWRPTLAREPLETGAGTEIATLVARHAGEPAVAGAPYWADSALLHDAGIPTVLYGPRGEGLHAEVEWVDVESLERCLGVYLAVAAELCA
ncbi:MAG: M20/M25/M40 family metallo-hydrolase [Thermoleophilia bacterium]|nr:M20/M25/M40 family metallo-hydrolase [Thermoleophilia bacterium]MDH5333580.1 M20/M25/M40 family metallo-hydrolase [Thermoleophilia bacterium]